MHIIIIFVCRLRFDGGRGAGGRKQFPLQFKGDTKNKKKKKQVTIGSWVKPQQLQEQRYPFLPVCAVFSCVLTIVWLPVFGISNVGTGADACDCARGLFGHSNRVCTGS